MKVNIYNTENKYSIIYADPPWQYKDRNCNGAAEHHYSCMTIQDIHALPVQQMADKDCILFMWATYPMIQEALTTIQAWGFHYKTIAFQWVKMNKNGTYFMGLGRWTRGNTECCLLATRGHPHRINAGISQLIVSPREKHSKKPEIVRQRIVELCGDLPRIELFAREDVPDWDCWGNEI